MPGTDVCHSSSVSHPRYVTHDSEHDGDVDLDSYVVLGCAPLHRQIENHILFGHEVGHPQSPRHPYVKTCGPDGLTKSAGAWAIGKLFTMPFVRRPLR